MPLGIPDGVVFRIGLSLLMGKVLDMGVRGSGLKVLWPGLCSL